MRCRRRIVRARFEQAEAIAIVQMRPAFSRAPQDGFVTCRTGSSPDADDV